MPPRWLLIAVILIYSITWIKSTIAADILNTLPVASNGWRPIIGSQVKPYITIDHNQQKQTISLTSNDHENKNKNEKNKIPPNTKGANSNQVHVNHHGSTGHHILPVVTVKQASKIPSGIKSPSSNAGKPAPRHPVMGKLHAHLAHAKRHKPVTKSTLPPLRDEIMAPAPSSAIGSYAYFNQGPISIQSSQLGNNKQFHSPGHVDFSNHFAFSSNVNNDVVLPQQQYTYQKHPNQNELHQNYLYYNQNDDFTRNLVPPPPIYKPQGEKETILIDKPQKNVEQNTQNSQLVLGKHKEEVGRFPENLILSSYNQYQQSNNQGFDLEITKEKFNEYHTTLAPTSYKTSTESFLDATKFTKNREIFTKPSFSGYEVTEEKEWAEQFPGFKALYPTAKPKFPTNQETRYQFSQQDYIKPSENVQIPYSQQDENINPHFLPTPYKAENAFPTSPTQAEISTIYSEISQLNKKKNTYKIPTSTVYNIKEVATHFPIFSDKRPETQTISTVLQPEYITETTTKKEEIEIESTLPYTKPTPQTTYPTRGPSRRPSHRRRRPSRPTTTTETVYTEENIYQPQNIETERPSVKPHRRRRPIKYRTTESPRETSTYAEPTTRIYRTRPTRPQTITEEVFVSQKHRHRPSYQTYNLDEDHTEGVKEIIDQDVVEETSTIENVRHNYQVENTPNNYQYEEESNIETEPPLRLHKRKRIRPYTTSTTTEALPSTNLNIPENELDYTTIPISNNDEQSEESATIKDIYDFDTEIITTSTTPITTTSTTTTTTTTTEAPTTKSNRLRRPIKYDVQRPRFSVKDYRQRFNDYMSSTSSTTETPKFNSESTRPKIKYPTRIRISTPGIENEESTEPIRQKFIPKERRKFTFSTESTTENTSTEKYQRTMNTRFKQYGRYRSSTEQPASTSTATTTQKISIKPNIFNNLKRPQQLSLRNRIYNKRNITTTTTTTEINTEQPKVNEPVTEDSDITIPFEIAESKIDVTTQLYNDFKIVEVPISSTQKPSVTIKFKNTVPQEQEVSTPDEAEAFLQLQRISDLTSSAHKQYNTPGMFKSVSPTSRRVPSYFTIATEDPILPIEAFFPNLNQKFNERQ